MRLNALLALLLSSIAPVTSILADEAYHVDYHQALLGIPQVETTFFHRPSASSSASLLYTLSDKAILGAVNPKDGSLLWRQPLAGPLPRPGLVAEEALGLSGEGRPKAFKATSAKKAGLLAEDGSSFVISYYGSTISAWDATNGKLLWQRVMPQQQQVQSASLVHSRSEASPLSVLDVVVLHGTEAGTILKLDGSSGALKWEHIDSSGALPRFVASAGKTVYYASEQSAVLGANSMKMISLDMEEGRETNSYSLKADEILRTHSCPDLAMTTWLDKSSKSIKVNLLGSSKVHTLALERSSGEEIEEVTIFPACGPASSLHFLARVQTHNGEWAEVFHVASKNAEIVKAYNLPYLKGQNAIAVSNIEEKVFFTRITDLEIELFSADSMNVLARWPRRQPSFGGPRHVQAEVVSRGQSTFAIRIAEVSRGGEWTLMRNGDQVWSRPELLANVVAAAWVDDLSEYALAHELDLEGHENPVSAYVHRVKRHLRDLQYFPAWLQQLPSSFMSGMLTSKNEAEKGLLGSKSLIVATSTGHYLALDPLRAGAIKWKRRAQEPSEEARVISLYVQDGIVTSFVTGLGIITINATDGRTISFDQSNTRFTKVAIAPGPKAAVAYRILEDGTPEATIGDDVAEDGTYLVAQSLSSSEVQGWMVGRSNQKLWTFSRGDQYQIANVVARPAHDPVSAIGKVLGDRSVLYKYLSENLILITSVKSDSFSIDLLDSITGTILYSCAHQNVDTSSPIPSVMSENWFTYSFFGNSDSTSPSTSKSHQLVMVELYESSLPNDRGPLHSTTNYSSFAASSIPLPHIITQSFTIPQPISHLSVTQTAQGITSRQLLATLPHLNAIIAIPRSILDPRRPLDRDPTPHEAEEGLFRYFPIVDLEPRFLLSHAREVMGVRRVITAPTRLESTSLVFAFGLDVFGTRVTPSKAFDVLGKGFNKIALLLTVVALGVGTVALAPVVRRKLVQERWKM